MAYNNDPEGALIQFASPEEARRAMQSTEAVLNNRFIRVHWHREDAVEHTHATPHPVSNSTFTTISARAIFYEWLMPLKMYILNRIVILNIVLIVFILFKDSN